MSENNEYNPCEYGMEGVDGCHTCPFREEMNNDYETLCDCNAYDTEQCAMDV